jgi:hypothetical protein
MAVQPKDNQANTRVQYSTLKTHIHDLKLYVSFIPILQCTLKIDVNITALSGDDQRCDNQRVLPTSGCVGEAVELATGCLVLYQCYNILLDSTPAKWANYISYAAAANWAT